MVVFFTNLKRIFRRKSNWLFMIILPILLISILIASLTAGSKYTIGIVDNDNTELTQIFADKLKEKCKIVNLKEEDIKSQVINSKVDGALLIDKGYTQNIIEGQEYTVKIYSIKESNTSVPIKLYIESFFNAAQNIGKASNGNAESFYKGIELYEDGKYISDYQKIDGSKSDQENVLSALGYLAMGMIFLLTLSTTLIIKDKQSKVFSRVLTGPISLWNYMLQNILSFVAVSAIQIAVIFLLMSTVFQMKFEGKAISLFVVFFIFALVSIALGVSITNLSKNHKQASSLISLINLPVCMLGGLLWPRDIMPDTLQKISNFVPTTWVMRAAEKVLAGKSLLDVSTELGVLILFVLVFFVISSVRIGKDVR